MKNHLEKMQEKIIVEKSEVRKLSAFYCRKWGKPWKINSRDTGHDCLAAHLRHIKIFSHNYCKICKLKNTTMEKITSLYAQNWTILLKNYQSGIGMPED
jgi:hypothetical protein